jgi:hypothetical protein
MQRPDRPTPRESPVKVPPAPPAMQPTLQEVADAALRAVERRETRRIRRVSPGSKLPPGKPSSQNQASPQWRTTQPEPPPLTFPDMRNRPRHRKQVLVALPPPHKRYLAYATASLVVIVVSLFGFAWARESAGWRNEALARKHGALLLQGTALRSQIDTLTQQALRMEEKSRILVEYAVDLRYSGVDDSRQLEQAGQAYADRDRLLNEVDKLRQRLRVVRRELAALED